MLWFDLRRLYVATTKDLHAHFCPGLRSSTKQYPSRGITARGYTGNESVPRSITLQRAAALNEFLGPQM